jgi:DNA gyrase subunit A
MCTRNGTIKKTVLTEFDNIRKSGIIAIDLEEGDILVEVKRTDEKADVMIGTKGGMSIRFPVGQIRPIGRSGKGVRGIRLDKDDQVIGMEVASQGTKHTLLTACVNGYGKRTDLSEYRDQNRGGSGVITIKTTDRNGAVVGLKLVTDDDDVMFMTEKGMTVRMNVKDLSVIGRNTQGFRLIRLEEGDKLSSIASVVAEGDEEEKA